MKAESTIKIVSFGEHNEDRWYLNNEGIRIPCTESTIQTLWSNWVMNPTAKRADDSKYTIFNVFKEFAIMINI